MNYDPNIKTIYSYKDMEEMRENVRRETRLWKLMTLCGFSLVMVFMAIIVILINLL